MLPVLDARRKSLKRLLISAAARSEGVLAYRDFIHDIVAETPEKILRPLLCNTRSTPRAMIEEAGHGEALEKLLALDPSPVNSTGLPLSPFHAGTLKLIKDSASATVGPDEDDDPKYGTEAGALRDLLHDLISVAPDAVLAGILANHYSTVYDHLHEHADADYVCELFKDYADDIASRRRHDIQIVLRIRNPVALDMLSEIHACADQHPTLGARLKNYYVTLDPIELRKLVGDILELLNEESGYDRSTKLPLLEEEFRAAAHLTCNSNVMQRCRRLDDVYGAIDALRSHPDARLQELTENVIFSARSADGFNLNLVTALQAKNHAEVVSTVGESYAIAFGDDCVETWSKVACDSMPLSVESEPEAQLSQ